LSRSIQVANKPGPAKAKAAAHEAAPAAEKGERKASARKKRASG
jgi:hypothetical protein